MVKYALLGMLREQPDHGYRLKKRFEERMGSLWRLNTGHVYQTLRALTKAGLVAEVRSDDDGLERDGLRPRRVFTLTTRGERTLERWLLLHTEAHIRWLEFTRERLRMDDATP
jgi:DNA-binding PadR family transcriptional regulator